MSVIIMPKMGDGMEEGTVLRWLKAIGDEVEVGDPIAEIETDKVAIEIESSEGGTFTQQLVAEGETVPIGTPIATVGDRAKSSKRLLHRQPLRPRPPPPRPMPPRQWLQLRSLKLPHQRRSSLWLRPTVGSDAQVIERTPGERLRASPIVKRLAAEHGIDLAAVAGTGPGGRIVKDDLTPYLTGAQPIPKAAPAPAKAPVSAPTDGTRPAGAPREMSRVRKTTGKRMTESKATIPHFYVSTDVDMGAAMNFRAQVNSQLTDDTAKISVNDLIVKAAALALREFPNLNASLEGDTLYDHDNIDVNVAVAIENGLIAPFVPDADKQPLTAIARMTKDLIGRAREGGLTPEEYQGGTFTISNLGMMDVAEFIAIVNPPQAAILAVGSAYDTPVFDEDGNVTVGKRMKITLSADHRITDGAEVAQFLQAIKRSLQNPLLMLV